ncbi:DMT family transporter [Arvimicrobium flavum]|uniref:DMT family transporter n=1 Tax=Arvimicrobium flavum TaxID=3393320 RepID=UPI00237AE499|nr:DMT family transporter [Mesorhizobium shangrilense]
MKSGVLLALAAYAIYAWGDGFIKALGGHLSVFEIGFFNILFAGIFLVFLTPDGERWHGFWRMQRPWAVHARALSGLASGVLSVYAFTTIPLAETYALIFLAPLFVTLLSIVVLKEHVGPWRWAAVVAGFCGILLVVRPGFRALELGHFAALAVAFLAAVTIVLMRSLAQEKQTTMLGVLVGYGLIFNGVAAAATSFTLPDWPILVLLAISGVCTAVGHRLQLLATRLSPANQIAPTHYSQIVWAVIIGAAFFAEYPDWLSLVGLVVVGGSGLLTLVREKVRLGTVRWNPFSRNRL